MLGQVSSVALVRYRLVDIGPCGRAVNPFERQHCGQLTCFGKHAVRALRICL